MTRPKKYGTLLLLFLITGLSIYGFFGRPIPGSGTLQNANAHIDAEDLAAAFYGNETLADSLYIGKILSVSGVIRRVGKDASGIYIASLSGRQPFPGSVRCCFNDLSKDHTPSLNDGDSVNIRGTCAGYLTDVILVQCIMEK